MQFVFRDVLEEKFGTEKTDEIFYDAGKLAGLHFYKQFLAEISDFNEFVKKLQSLLKDMGIGILRIEKADIEAGSFVLTVSEVFNGTATTEIDTEICVYDEGFIAGLMESFTGSRFKVKEIDCWCTGDRTCRFTAEAIAS